MKSMKFCFLFCFIAFIPTVAAETLPTKEFVINIYEVDASGNVVNQVMNTKTRIQCNQPADVGFQKMTTYPSDPPVSGLEIRFDGQLLLTGCESKNGLR